MASVAVEHRNRRTAAIMAVVAAGMLALGFAAVPLYRIFCQVTGFAGTTQRATDADAVTAAEMAQQRRRAHDLDPLRRQHRARSAVEVQARCK